MTEYKSIPLQTFLSRKKFLTPFTIGKNKLIAYGSPAFMATKSSLIHSYLQTTTESFELLSFMDVGNAFFSIWYHMNGFPLEFSQMNLVDTYQAFSIAEYFNLDETVYGSKLMKSLLDNIKLLNKDELLNNSQQIISKLTKYKSPIIMYHLYEQGVTDIISKLDHILFIFKADTISIAIHPKEILTDGKILDRVLEDEGYSKVSDRLCRSKVLQGFGLDSMYEINIEPNAIIVTERDTIWSESG